MTRLSVMRTETDRTMLCTVPGMSAICSPLDWDSDHFGFPIGRIAFTSPDGPVAPDGIGRFISDIMSEVAVLGWRLTYTRIEANQSDLAFALEENGFRLMDQLVTFRGSVQTAEPHDFVRIHRIDGLSDEERRQVCEMSMDSFVHSRFYADRRLDRACVDAMYARWVQSVLSAGDLHLAFVGDQVAGYVACSREGSGVRIQLISVAAPARGRGVGKALVAHVKRYYASECSFVVVGTQLANSAAISLYSACGLVPVQAELSFHKWNG